jgi:hypothetical protein
MPEEETIIGQKITSVRKLTPEDYEREGWDHDRFAIGAVLVLENGTVLYASRDDEGNGPGTLIGADADGTSFYVATA